MLLGGLVLVESLRFTNREEWRAWLNTNHNDGAEVWLAIKRKGSDRTGTASRRLWKRRYVLVG